MFKYVPIEIPTSSAVKLQKDQLKLFEIAHFNQFSVEELIANRTVFYDEILKHLWHYFKLNEHDATVIAVGGYGRAEMFPLSDLDFLILTAELPSAIFEEKICCFVQFLWDCGFDVGHSVRTLSQCHEEGQKDISIATNLLESRYLCGNIVLFEKLNKLLNQTDFWTLKDFYYAKIAEKEERYQRYNNTGYNLEPDVKFSPGGLRDLHLLYWLALRHTGLKKFAQILQVGMLYPEEYQLLQKSQQFLFKVRFALHLILKRYDNRLLFDRQLKVSEMLGYTGQGNQAVENMMKDFFQTLQSISLLSHILVKYYRKHIISGDEFYIEQNLDQNFKLVNNEIKLINQNCFTEQVESILDLFYHLTVYPESEIHATTLRNLHLRLRNFEGYLSQSAVARQKFLRILAQPKAIKRALVPMHQFGVLDIYLPEWKGIKGLMQFDLFHVYTVDEHTLRVLQKLEDFLDPKYVDAHPLCTMIFPQLSDRTLIYLVALFHDIGKGRNGDHAQLGAKDMAKFAAMHGFDQREIQTMSWLVDKHLLMSITAQRRDIHDPQIVMAFAAEVQNKVRLDYLICLTVADICATNETLWNSWKRSLLATLYHYAHKQFQQGMDHLLDNQEKIKQNRNQALTLLEREYPILSEDDILQLWCSCPDEYFLRNTPKQIAWHTGLRSELDSEFLVKISNRFSLGGTEIFIYCKDQPHLFNKVVTTIGAKQFSVHNAQIITAPDGYVFDTFIITELNGDLVRFDRRRYLEQSLRATLETEKIPCLNLKKDQQLQHFRVKTEVCF